MTHVSGTWIYTIFFILCSILAFLRLLTRHKTFWHIFFGYNFIIFDCTMQHMGSLFPNQELNSTRPLQWKPRILSIGQPGKFQHCKSVFTFITYFDSHNILKRYNYPHNMMRNSSLWGAHLPWMSAQPSSSHNWQSPQEPSFWLISWVFGP